MTQVPDSSGLVFSEDRLVLPDNPEAILGLLRTVLAKPFIQNITIDAGGDIVVSWYRDPADSLLDSPEETADDVLGRVDLTDSDYGGSFKENLVDAMSDVSLAGYFPTHILCGEVEALKESLGVPKIVRLPKSASVDRGYYFMGLLIVETSLLAGDTAVLCGCKVRSEEVGEVRFGVRLLMEKLNE